MIADDLEALIVHKLMEIYREEDYDLTDRTKLSVEEAGEILPYVSQFLTEGTGFSKAVLTAHELWKNKK